MPLISVVIPTYNRAALVAETIDSALTQEGFADFEVIVVDDGSTDDTPELLGRYGERIRVVRQANTGLGASRNVGIAQAKGEYIALLDDDDLWLPWTLKTYARAISESAAPWLVSSSMIEFTHGDPLPRLDEGAYAATTFANLFAAADAGSYWVVPSGACFRADIARRLGGFFTLNYGHEETDLWLRAGDQPGFVRVDRPVCVLRRVHSSNLSGLSDRNYNGTAHILEQERQGAYPGEGEMARQRRTMLASQVRAVAMACAHHGAVRRGWRLYSDTLAWNLAAGRYRFLLGWPVLAALGALRVGLRPPR